MCFVSMFVSTRAYFYEPSAMVVCATIPTRTMLAEGGLQDTTAHAPLKALQLLLHLQLVDVVASAPSTKLVDTER